MTRIILIRHGETVWNAEGRIQGHEDIALSERGVRQAQLVAERLSNIQIHAVYSSDLLRAKETAEIIAARHGLKVNPTSALREAYLGSWQGKTLAEVAETDPELVALWLSNSAVHRPPKAEKLEDVQARAVAAVKQITEDHPDQNVAVVAHGGPIKAIICWAIEAPISSMRLIRLDNGSITCIRGDKTRMRLEVCNDTCHLDSNKVTPVF